MKIGIHYNTTERGPGKVVRNLISGLTNLGLPYVTNSEGDKNVVLQTTDRLYGDLSNCIVGPNICTLPVDNHIVNSPDRYFRLIVPSEWVKNLYSKWIPEEKMVVWPVGIDTDTFNDKSNSEKSIDYLIYHKRRSDEDLRYVLDFLDTHNKTYCVFTYGNYSEDSFLSAMEKSKRGIVLAGTESQGIAIQEMMSCNLPLLVWDVQEWNDRGQESSCPATCVPYFDKTCGIIFYDRDKFEEAYRIFSNQDYNPRKYVIDNLGLNMQAEKLIHLFQNK